MLLEECPITKEENRISTKKILSKFNRINPSSRVLHLKKYLESYPEKLFCNSSFELYLNNLENGILQNPNAVISFFKENSKEIDIGINNLNEINKLHIHDCLIPEANNLVTIQFIENSIHFNYLKILESSYTTFLKLPAILERLYRDKSFSRLDLYHIVEELKKTELSPLTKPYDHTIRNGIAHGNVSYLEHSTVYKGKRGDPKEIRTKKIIDLFDNLIDIVNGVALAFKIFLINNREFLQKEKYSYPQSIAIEELKALGSTPQWEIKDCLSNKTINNEEQLNIFIKTNCRTHNEVNYYGCRTAILSEYFVRNYQRYYLSIEATYSSLIGFGGYDGKILKINREAKSENLKDYKNVLLNNLFFFVPKFKIPQFLSAFFNFYIIIKQKSLWDDFHKKTENKFRKKYSIRDSKQHRRKYSIVVSDMSIVLNEFGNENALEYVKNNYKKIVKKGIKHSKRKIHPFWGRFLKTSYIRIMIYDTDYRTRKLRDSGLIDSLVCTICLSKSKKIKLIDIFNSNIEQKDKYRIAWHRNWLKNIR
ncbi:hypothetical protein MHM83_14375 [Tenacibaculum sp. Mcav3-52]|uniref:hypothetical protein n=1 Tax=Tenacibaculum sp. Mcav3-52 TaxID=2917762 RepID=UPI001EF18A6F|nr:hypothetical protein [Tenacibaculum sp. Mcav3-52]MCG7503054.1 hypothetical protein [Tenacibaculum sp. Mcav3-52]